MPNITTKQSQIIIHRLYNSLPASLKGNATTNYNKFVKELTLWLNNGINQTELLDIIYGSNVSM